MNRTFFLKATAVAALSVATASVASAQMNLFNFTGQVAIRATGSAPTDPLLLDFLSGTPPVNASPAAPGTITTGTNTGIFSSIAAGTTGTIQDLAITAAGAVTNPNTMANMATFVTASGYTFTLGPSPVATGGEINFGPIRLTSGPTGAAADLFVRGTVTGPGIAPGTTTYVGVLSAQFAGQTAAEVFNQFNMAGGSQTVTFSGNFAASVIPEPSTYALLATGIGALGFVARRRRQQA